jgi:hypothetical protein
MFQRHVLFHAGDDVDGVGVFPDRPLPEVDDRPIPDGEDFLAFMCTLAQGFDIQPFEHAHVVGLFLGAITPKGEMRKMMKKVFDESFEVFVSARTFAGFEVVAFGEVHDASEHSFLDKVASRIVLSDDTLESGVDPVFIGDDVTAVLVSSGLLEFKQRCEEVSEGRAAGGAE